MVAGLVLATSCGIESAKTGLRLDPSAIIVTADIDFKRCTGILRLPNHLNDYSDLLREKLHTQTALKLQIEHGRVATKGGGKR